MSEIQRNAGIALVAALVAVSAALLETLYIADPDLRYAIVLLTKMLGAIVVTILVIRVPWVFLKEKARAISAGAEEGLKSIGRALLTTIASLGGCMFGVSLISPKPGVIEYWPLGIVFMFGGTAVIGVRYLRRVWRTYVYFRAQRHRD